MRYLSGRASTREEVEAGHARRLASAQKVDGLGFWVGIADDEFVGWWTFQPAHGPDQPDDPGVADLGYRLLQRHWRKGLASEGPALVRYGFDDVGLDRIIAQTITVNAASRAVMERVGLTYVRALPPSMTGPVEGARGGGSRVRDDARAVGARYDLDGEARRLRKIRDRSSGPARMRQMRSRSKVGSMYARAVDEAELRLRELRHEQWLDLALAAVAFGLALAATQIRPSLAMPLFLGGVFAWALGIRALYRHWDLLDRLADERDAFVIPEVALYASRHATGERRRVAPRR